MTSHRFLKELNFARNAALQAGEIALKHYKTDIRVTTKEDNSPVTAADREIDSFINQELATHFPGDAVLSEESKASPDRHINARLWCVDPIDGTKEFIAKNGEFVVMIGLALRGEAKLGVVYQPTTGFLIWGCDGMSGVENSAPGATVRVSSTHEFNESTVMISRRRDTATIRETGTALGIKHFAPMGSLGLKLAQLALGKAEIYISFSNLAKEWDTCAPEAILRAAGGIVTDGLARPLRYNKKDCGTHYGIVATNGILHQPCLDAVSPYVQEQGW